MPYKLLWSLPQISPASRGVPSCATCFPPLLPTTECSARMGTTEIYPFSNAHPSDPSGRSSSLGFNTGRKSGANWNLSCLGAASPPLSLRLVGSGVGSAFGPAGAELCDEVEPDWSTG